VTSRIGKTRSRLELHGYATAEWKENASLSFLHTERTPFPQSPSLSRVGIREHGTAVWTPHAPQPRGPTTATFSVHDLLQQLRSAPPRPQPRATAPTGATPTSSSNNSGRRLPNLLRKQQPGQRGPVLGKYFFLFRSLVDWLEAECNPPSMLAP
jgi:hypothetical protein